MRHWLTSNKWHYAILSGATTIIITVKPAIAGVPAKSMMNIESILNLAQILLFFVLGLQIITGLALIFWAYSAISRGEKAFNAFGPSLVIFLLGFLASLLFGVAMGSFNRILIYTAVINGFFFVSFLIETWRASFLDE